MLLWIRIRITQNWNLLTILLVICIMFHPNKRATYCMNRHLFSSIQVLSKLIITKQRTLSNSGCFITLPTWYRDLELFHKLSIWLLFIQGYWKHNYFNITDLIFLKVADTALYFKDGFHLNWELLFDGRNKSKFFIFLLSTYYAVKYHVHGVTNLPL